MARISPLIALPPLIFLGLGALFMVGLNRDDVSSLPSTLEGQQAPSLAVKSLGELPVITEAALRKPEVKLVNFWASWCAPCRAEHPNLQVLSELGLPIYGVNYKDQDAKGLKFLNELGNPYTAVGTDALGREAINWGVYGIPETFVVDANGRIILRFAGPITRRALTATILPAIKKAQNP